MKIQRHVRQDFQPAYIKLETLSEVRDMATILAHYRASDEVMADPLCLAKEIEDELVSIINAGGILP
jgi:hypothetical protein